MKFLKRVKGFIQLERMNIYI